MNTLKAMIAEIEAEAQTVLDAGLADTLAAAMLIAERRWLVALAEAEDFWQEERRHDAP